MKWFRKKNKKKAGRYIEPPDPGPRFVNRPMGSGMVDRTDPTGRLRRR
jgi:hypothetical protein